MARRKIPLTVDLLKQLLVYDPLTGLFVWKERTREMFPTHRSWMTWNTKHAGRAAFTSLDADGYLMATIWGNRLRSHRVAWAMQTGTWPKDQIDHEDHNRAHNVFTNLVEATQIQNARNQKKFSNNTSGTTGVYQAGAKWRARAKVNGKMLDFGTYASKEDAIEARKNGGITHGFHSNHGGD